MFIFYDDDDRWWNVRVSRGRLRHGPRLARGSRRWAPRTSVVAPVGLRSRLWFGGGVV